MACITADGALTESARELLALLEAPQTIDEIAGTLGRPLFQVRASVREMTGAGLIVTAAEGGYITTAEGRAQLGVLV